MTFKTTNLIKAKRTTVKTIYGLLLVAVAVFLPDISYAAGHSLDTAIKINLQKVQRGKIDLAAESKLQKELSSKAYLAVNLSSGKVFAGKNVSKVYPIASVTKLMNAVVFLENAKLSDAITLTQDMLLPVGHSPVLYPGLSINGEKLLHVSLIQSCNDAANSLSYLLGAKHFIFLMNRKAKFLGMNHTHFADSYGLDPGNRSSASDLVKLLSYIYKKHPDILAITKENDFWLPDRQGTMLKLKNVNDLYSNPEFVGAKAGYIPQSKQTLASVADINSVPVAIVLLHSRNRTSDAIKIASWIKNGIDRG